MMVALLALPACTEGTTSDDDADGSGGGTMDSGDGSDAGGACEGVAPTCTDQELIGDCSDAIDEQPATCVMDQWECPSGFAFEDEVNCEWPIYCDGAPPTCFEAGDCEGATESADCAIDTWACPPGTTLECSYACEPGDDPPDECWDQGPGECSDATVPPDCTDGTWQCPDGFDFGGFGEDCEFPRAVPGA